MAADNDKDEGVETRKVSKDEAAFILGQGGKTKAKLCTVSGAQLELTEVRVAGQPSGSQLLIKGTARQRKLARKYVEFVVAQRLGPVTIDDPSAHDDLTILVVPADTVSFITGKQGSFLRLVEEEWGALLFFLQVNPKNPQANPGGTERLAIFGPERRRRGAQLKVMSAIEMKLPGYFTKNVGDSESADDGFGTDTASIKEEDYSYALGRSGSTRKKLARASSCIVEYVGRVAYFCGSKPERMRAKEYLTWLLKQRSGEQVHVDHKGRDDVSVIMVPSSCLGFVTGFRGASLRSIEEETSTFCFIEGTADDGEDQKPLLIFGCIDDRRMAETLVWERISTKYDEVVVGSSNGGKKGKGKGKDSKGKGKGKESENGYYKGGKGGGYGSQETVAAVPYEREARVMGPHEGKDVIDITEEDAAFIMGPGGKTRRKIAAVSGADLELKNRTLEIVGTTDERQRAMKYVQLVMAQRLGPVRVENPEEHDDLTIIEVPAEAVSFVTGTKGSFLRLVEEEFGTMLFFIDFNKTNRRDQLERLAIFGPLRERRGAELKVMAAIEMKQPGHFTRKDSLLPQDPEEGFGTDRIVIEEDDYSYALGKGGATRKKIARASNCVIEYIGRLAYLSGLKKERTRAREYLGWLFRQRVGPVDLDYSNREDVTVLQVPKDCVGFVTGHKGTSLRQVEEATGTFCFIEGGREDPYRDPKPLLIFGGPDARRQAEEMLRKRIDLKLVEGWVHEDGYGGGGSSYDRGYNSNYSGYGGHGEAGGEKGSGKQRKPSRPMTAYGNAGSAPNHEASSADRNFADVAAAEPDDDGAWGNWGGDSDDEACAQKAQAPGSALPAASGQGSTKMSAAELRSNQQLLGTTGRWAGGHSPYSAAQGAPTPAPQAAPQRSAPAPYRAEELDLPPQLLHEEAWPELGMMGGKKARK